MASRRHDESPWSVGKEIGSRHFLLVQPARIRVYRMQIDRSGRERARSSPPGRTTGIVMAKGNGPSRWDVCPYVDPRARWAALDRRWQRPKRSENLSLIVFGDPATAPFHTEEMSFLAADPWPATIFLSASRENGAEHALDPLEPPNVPPGINFFFFFFNSTLRIVRISCIILNVREEKGFFLSLVYIRIFSSLENSQFR